MGRVVIVGSGNVGSCAAQTIALRGLAEEVVLLDKRPARARRGRGPHVRAPQDGRVVRRAGGDLR